MKYRILSITMVVLVLTSSCSSKKKIAQTYKKRQTERVETASKPTVHNSESSIQVEEIPKDISFGEAISKYIEYYSSIAKEEMLQYGIPASITLAQGILESGAGRGELTQKANNHFGIKCHKEWKGDKVFHDDDESQECFRKYRDPKYSFRDHSLFLTQRSRYQDLFKLRKDDYKGWAKGLKKAGYATDPKYSDKLISLIERYNLSSYDQQVLNTSSGSSIPDNAKIATHTVQKGDTLYNIARRFNVTVDTIKKYNGLKTDAISVGQVLYLHSVNNK